MYVGREVLTAHKNEALQTSKDLAITEKGEFFKGVFTKKDFRDWANRTRFEISDKIENFLNKLPDNQNFTVKMAASDSGGMPVLTINAGQYGTYSDKVTWDELSRVLAGEAYELRGKTGKEIVDFLKKHNAWDNFRSRFGEAAKILTNNPEAQFDLTSSGKVTLDQQRTVFSALNSFSRGRENIFKAFDQGKVSDFYVRMDLDRDGRRELYRLSGRYTLDRGIMDFKGDVYRVTPDGSEVKINPRGGITTIEGLQVSGITHGKAEAEDAFNVPTVKLSMFSVGADGRMSMEGVREILKTFSMATDKSLDSETKSTAMARGEFYLHILENDPALRSGFVKTMTDLIHTYIQETHDVDIANRIAAGVKSEVGVKSNDSVVGKIINLMSGWAASFKFAGDITLQKKAEESTTVNKFAGAIEGIISEANHVLSDEKQMQVLGNIYDKAVGKALTTVRKQPGEYETDRSFGRVITGSIPGVDVGRTGERLVHATKEMLSGVKDAAGDVSTDVGKGMKDAFRDAAKGAQDLSSHTEKGIRDLLDFDIKK